MGKKVSQTASKRCPIHFDHESPEHARDWADDFRQMRQKTPRAWTENYGGFWVATRYEDVVAIAQRSDVFTTHKAFDPETGEMSGGLFIPPLPGVRSIPNETESPEWEGIRGFINRRFAPRAVEKRREETARLVDDLIDNVIETGRFDIVNDLTNPLPAMVTLTLFGFPLEEWPLFAGPFHKMIYTPKDDPTFAETEAGLAYFQRRVDEEIEKRRVEPRDDLLGYMATGTIDGEPLDRETIQQLAFNIMGGGLDTTTALTSNTLMHLGLNPDLKQQLIDDPELLPFAREEYVRFVSPIHGLARNAKADVEIDGWQFEKGDRVLLAYASANRDPEVFNVPGRVVLDRFPNKHIGFGAGMHRCLGSFLARMMFEEMVKGVLERMPDYRIDEANAVPYPSVALVNGWIEIPATFTLGPKKR